MPPDASLIAAPSPDIAMAAAAQINSGDTAWMLVSTILVILMLLPGLALFYGGMVRKKNLLAMLMQHVGGAAVVTLVWVVCGYSLAFTEGNPIIGGLSRMFLQDLGPSNISPLAPNIPETVFLMFQASFAMLTPILLLGGPADRMKFGSAMLFVALWTLFDYCPIAHMVWGPGGFLNDRGILDFAGGTVVHINSGVGGLVAAIMLGKRRGVGSESLAPHNLSLSLIGAALMWVGWFGFNAGSSLTAGGSAGYAMLTTHVAASAGVIAWVGCEWVFHRRPSLLGGISGAVAGLVAITPGCGFVSVASAVVIGLCGGFAGYLGVGVLKRAFKYDDALDSFGVHGVVGVVGAILTGIFAVSRIGGSGKAGLADGHYAQILVQIEGVAVTVIWSAVVSFILLKFIDRIMGLRVSAEDESMGLDLALHGETMR